MGVVDQMLNPERSFDAAMSAVELKLAQSENHEGVWASLDATQRALVRMLANNPSLKPFGASNLVLLRKAIGVDSLKTTHIQRAMANLKSIVVKTPRDIYEFENEAFALWVRTLAD